MRLRWATTSRVKAQKIGQISGGTEEDQHSTAVCQVSPCLAKESRHGAIVLIRSGGFEYVAGVNQRNGGSKTIRSNLPSTLLKMCEWASHRRTVVCAADDQIHQVYGLIDRTLGDWSRRVKKASIEVRSPGTSRPWAASCSVMVP